MPTEADLQKDIETCVKVIKDAGKPVSMGRLCKELGKVLDKNAAYKTLKGVKHILAYKHRGKSYFMYEGE